MALGSFRIDAGELDNLAIAFREAGPRAAEAALAVVKRGAQNIKTDAQNRVKGLPHAPAYPRAISYDTHPSPVAPWAEIGPDKAKPQGALGNLIEYGSVHNPGGRPHMRPAGEAEEPKFASALDDLAVKILAGF